MPIYELKCKQCNEIGEYLVYGSFEGETCKYCGNVEFEQLMSVFGFKSENKFKSAGNVSCSGCKKGSCSSCA